VPLDDYAMALLTQLKEQAADRQPSDKTPVGKFSRDHVFVTPLGTPRRNNLLRAFYAVCKRAGIEGGEQGGSIDLHALRGTFATLAIENGASPKAVQTILGHSTLALTMGVYAKATERAKREAVAALPFAKVSEPAHIIPLPKRTEKRTSNSGKAQTEEDKVVAT
jgi:integrase